MRRVVSVWFPHWATDRLQRGTTPPEPPFVTAVHDGRRRVIAAADPVAAGLGLRPGMAMAQALAVVPGLQILEAAPDSDAEALLRLARWCQRTTPLVSVDGPDGLWLDVTGCAHLFGSEAALLDRLRARLARDGLQARAAVADTPGAAYALARHADAPSTVAPPGGQATLVAGLPVGALRLSPDTEAVMRRLGFERVGHLGRIPRALLARRFGPLPALRLDQVQGRVLEPLAPLPPEQVLQRRTAFVEPLLTADSFKLAIAYLTGPLCAAMEEAGLGARQLDLLFERVDNQVAAIRIGTARPTRDAGHLTRLLEERLDQVDPGLGVEAMRLVVSLAEPLRWEQQDDGTPQDASRLVDRLVNRLGADRVYQAAAVESAFPERSVRQRPTDGNLAPAALPQAAPEPPSPPSPTEPLPPRPGPKLDLVAQTASPGLAAVASIRGSSLRLVPAEPPPCHEAADPPVQAWRRPWQRPKPLAAGDVAWPDRLQAPARLFDPPRPVEALAALPDQPPLAFTWRRHRHRIRRADGPERIYGEWWQRDGEGQAVRDYFQVEDENGRRFWLFRNGNGIDPRTGDLTWFLHGLF